MRPCASRRESVALLASGACPDDQADELRRHLKTCAGCRESFRRLAEVRDEHVAAATNLPEASVPSRLLNRVASRIRVDAEPRRGAPWTSVLLDWRGIVGWAALLAVVVGGALWFREPSKPAPTLSGTGVSQPPSVARTTTAPPSGNRLVSYRLALNHSPEALEAMLQAETVRSAPPPRITLRSGPGVSESEL